METKKCNGCNADRDISQFGEFKTCDICRERQREFRKTKEGKARKKQYYLSKKEEYKKYGFEYRRTIIGRFKKSKSTAKRSGVIFGLTFEEYSQIISKPCYYCDGFFSKVTAGSGLDKLNPCEGYVVGNCVSCCDTCNTLKNSVFSPEETMAAVLAIIKVRKDNNVKDCYIRKGKFR